jgi:hypothetical protein
MITLTPNDLPVGQPLPWSLLDGEGNLLLGSGSVIPDGRDVALVFRHGSVCRPDAEPEADGKGGRAANAGPLGLQVGTLLQIKAADDVGRTAASRLIGFIDQGLFVSWPQLGGREIQFKAGESVVLRGFSGQAILSFSCTVTAVCRTPFRYLVLSAPEQVQQLPVRRSARVPTRLAAYVLGPDDEAATEGNGDPAGKGRLAVLSDLSAGGALVHTSFPAPPVGSALRLRFLLRTAAGDSEVTVDAWARGVASEETDAEFPAFGVAFDVLEEREAALLQCFIYEQMLASASMRV